MSSERSEADELVKKITAEYEQRIAQAPLGESFQESCDVRRASPTVKYAETVAP